jgi:hypothetical protein
MEIPYYGKSNKFQIKLNTIIITFPSITFHKNKELTHGLRFRVISFWTAEIEYIYIYIFFLTFHLNRMIKK